MLEWLEDTIIFSLITMFFIGLFVGTIWLFITGQWVWGVVSVSVLIGGTMAFLAQT